MGSLVSRHLLFVYPSNDNHWTCDIDKSCFWMNGVLASTKVCDIEEDFRNGKHLSSHSLFKYYYESKEIVIIDGWIYPAYIAASLLGRLEFVLRLLVHVKNKPEPTHSIRTVKGESSIYKINDDEKKKIIISKHGCFKSTCHNEGKELSSKLEMLGYLSDTKGGISKILNNELIDEAWIKLSMLYMKEEMGWDFTEHL